MRNSAHNTRTGTLTTIAAAGALAFSAQACADGAADLTPRAFEIHPQSVSTALRTFADQAGMQLLFAEKDIGPVDTAGVTGNLSPRDALATMLRGTGLQFEITANNVIVVRRPQTLSHVQGAGGQASSIDDDAAEEKAARRRLRVAQAEEDEAPAEDSTQRVELEEVAVHVPEILIRGSMSLNGDIPRTRDDIQPYVVFDAEEIRHSQATNLEEFLKTRLPMNAQMDSKSQSSHFSGDTRSTINLRGLGANQTLILVDGRRLPDVSGSGDFEQPDINGIPVAAVERIEVLPSSASGIYGGSATGGVVNIILKRNYSGLEVAATYANTFDTVAGNRRLDISGGASLGDRTRLSFAASHADSEPLQAGDRDFARRSRALRLANDPNGFAGDLFPPPSSTPNIRGSLGEDLVLDDGTPLNSPITHVPAGYAGGDGGAALLRNAGRYNYELPDDLQGLRASLLNAPTVDSVSATLRHEFSEHVEAYLDVASLRNRGISHAAGISDHITLARDAPNNPFDQDIEVSFPTSGLSLTSRTKSETRQAVAGAIVRLPHEWSANASYSWDRSRYQSTVALVLDAAGYRSLSTGLPPAAPDTRPALDGLSGTPLDFGPYVNSSSGAVPDVNGPDDTILKVAQLRLSGPIFALPAGPLVLSSLFERRDEDAKPSFERQKKGLDDDSITYLYQPLRSQDVSSVYLEANAPLISDRNAWPWLHALEVQASVRRDAYTTRGAEGPEGLIEVSTRTPPDGPLLHTTNKVSSTDHTLGFRAVPVEDVTLRASYGTGFLPPSIAQIVPQSQVFNLEGFEPDPKRGGDTEGASFVGDIPFTWITNGNPALTPERSRSWSMGVIFTPRFAPGLRFSVDYTRIKKSGEITFVDPAFILAHEDGFPDRVVRDPSLKGPNDPPDWAGPVVRLDTSPVNIATARLQAYDFQLDYIRDTERFGEFRFYSVATMQKELTRQPLPGGETIDVVGTYAGPLKWSGNAGLTWFRGPWTVNWNAQYFDSYCLQDACAIATFQGSATVPSVIFHDVSLTYQFGEEAGGAWGVLSNTMISLGVLNVFNQIPTALVENNNQTGSYSTYGADPRLRRFSLTLRKSFGTLDR